MLWVMVNKKTWLVEAEFAACLLAVAFVAFTLMVGQSLWRSMIPQLNRSASRHAALKQKRITH
jgi:hypothetical protein